MRFIATIRSLAYSGAMIGLIACGDAAAGGAPAPVVVHGMGAAPRPSAPHIVETGDGGRYVPSDHRAGYHHTARPSPHVRQGHDGRHHGAVPYGAYGGVYHNAYSEGRYDGDYRPAAYSAADAYLPPPPRSYGYIVRPIVVEPPYPAADYIELTGFQPLPHIIHLAPEHGRTIRKACPCDARR